MTYFNDPAIPRFQDPDYTEAPIVYCEICDCEVYEEDQEHCEDCRVDYFCEECGEYSEEIIKVAEKEGYCPDCYEEDPHPPLHEKLGLDEGYDIARIKPSCITLEKAAAKDFLIVNNEANFDCFIKTLLDWMEKYSWIYTSQAVINRGYEDFAKEVTQIALHLNEVAK